MKILLMGPPASGKGTVGEKLSTALGLPLISVGAVLREMPKDHPRYQEVFSLMQIGALAPQDFVGDLLARRVSQGDCAHGYVLDGWGRSMENLTYFNPGFDKVIALNLSLETALDRITLRRSCQSCGEIFNLKFVPPITEGVCDKCGSALVQRKDDTEEVVRTRYKIQWLDAADVIEKFRQEGILIEIDAEPEPEIVFQNTLTALKQS